MNCLTLISSFSAIFSALNQLPGYNIQYPANEIGELYKKFLADDGIEMSKDDIPEATAKGSYRKLIQRAANLKWEAVPETEDESLQKGSPLESEDSVVTAARLTFELESGCYATMMLRELLVSSMARDSKKKEEL